MLTYSLPNCTTRSTSAVLAVTLRAVTSTCVPPKKQSVCATLFPLLLWATGALKTLRLYSAAKRISHSKRRNDAACCSGGTGKHQRARHGAKANALPFSIFQCSPGRRSLAYLRTGNIGAGTVSPSDIQSPACNQLRKQGFFRASYPGGKTVPAPIFPLFWLGPLGSFGAIFSGLLSKKREKSAKGKKKSCECGNSFMLNNEVAGEWAVFSAIVSST